MLRKGATNTHYFPRKETKDQNAPYWPMLRYVDKFVMFADSESDAHCTVFTYCKDNTNTLIVAFRGTEKTEGDLLADAYFRLEALKHQSDPLVMVDEGFQYQYNVLRHDLRNYLTMTSFDRLFITGHSLGNYFYLTVFYKLLIRWCFGHTLRH